MSDVSIGFLVPFYNHGQFAEQLFLSIAIYGLPIIMVDDGSNESHRHKLQKAIKEQQSTVQIIHIQHEKNQGKGAAVISGFEKAKQLGFTHVIQIDADCQHDFTQIPIFIHNCKIQPKSLICGYPEYDASVPKSRLYPRYITHFWVWVNTLSFSIKDSMCGFRCYPVDPVIQLFQHANIGKHMDFDIDIIVRLYWAGLSIINLPVKVIYHSNASSHFRLWADNALISKIHTRLFFGMLLHFPSLLLRHVSSKRKNNENHK